MIRLYLVVRKYREARRHNEESEEHGEEKVGLLEE
jgi:hypothetical protein